MLFDAFVVSETEAAVSTVENQQPAEDPPTLKFTWTVPNFSRQNTRKHYSQVHMSLELCFKRRAPFAPRRKAHSGDSPIAMHLPGEGMVPKACAMVRF